MYFSTKDKLWVGRLPGSRVKMVDPSRKRVETFLLARRSRKPTQQQQCPGRISPYLLFRRI